MTDVLAQIAALEEQKQRLLATAKQDQLNIINKAITELDDLGFNYRLVEGKSAADPVRSRRSGVRQDVLEQIQAHQSITRAQLLEQMGVKGNKSGEQSISNAIAALKKAGQITAKDGAYSVV